MRGSNYIFVIAIIYTLLECRHFGWHFFPRSDFEVVCDGIAWLMLAIAALTDVIERKR